MPVSKLTCFSCQGSYAPNEIAGLCDCGRPLRVDFELPKLSREELVGRRKDLWRYREMLPLPPIVEPKSLGEGGTPLIPVAGESGLLIKDEALNPTGSFKARGMALAVAMAAHFGIQKLAVPSAGNAGGAMAAYAALHDLEAHVFMPKDVPIANRLECELYGAKVTLVDGLITDCAKLVMEGKEREGWFDVSTLKEPYRIEGKKTMGYEIVEQLGWKYPDAIFYPTGGGTGLIGMWKAFQEMERLGWVAGKRPKMFSVQAEGCAPIANAWKQGPPNEGLWTADEVFGAQTIAAGLRVPRAIGDFVMLNLLRDSGGGAVAVSDEDLIDGARHLSRLSGGSVCPEGGACFIAYERALETGVLQASETVVLFNTGTATKYIEAFSAQSRN